MIVRAMLLSGNVRRVSSESPHTMFPHGTIMLPQHRRFGRFNDSGDSLDYAREFFFDVMSPYPEDFPSSSAESLEI